MGGINHQPCGKYLSRSTKMSRHVSKGIIHLESANVAFEDLILSSLDGGTGSTEEIRSQLWQAGQSMRDMIAAVNDLTAFMRESGYQDLPPLRTLDLDAIGRDFIGRGMVTEAWNSVVATLRTGGFYAMFGEFVADAQKIIAVTESLEQSFVNLEQVAMSGEIQRVLEENSPGNVRPAFAKVYTTWHAFHQRFLASSLVSSEVWYAFNGFGSMAHGVASLRSA